MELGSTNTDGHEETSTVKRKRRKRSGSREPPPFAKLAIKKKTVEESGSAGVFSVGMEASFVQSLRKHVANTASEGRAPPAAPADGALEPLEGLENADADMAHAKPLCYEAVADLEAVEAMQDAQQDSLAALPLDFSIKTRMEVLCPSASFEQFQGVQKEHLTWTLGDANRASPSPAALMQQALRYYSHPSSLGVPEHFLSQYRQALDSTKSGDAVSSEDASGAQRSAMKATGAVLPSLLGVDSVRTGAGVSVLRKQVLQFFQDRLDHWKEALSAAVAELGTARSLEDSLVYVVGEKWSALVGARHCEEGQGKLWAILSASTPGQRKRLKEAGASFTTPYLQKEKKRVTTSVAEEKELKALPGGKVIEDVTTVGDGTVMSQLVMGGKENIDILVRFLQERAEGQLTRLPVVLTTFPFLHGTLTQIPVTAVGTVTRSKKGQAQSESLYRLEIQGMIHPACGYRFLKVIHASQEGSYTASLTTLPSSCRLNCSSPDNRGQAATGQEAVSGRLQLSYASLADTVVSHIRCHPSTGLQVARVTTRD